MKRLSRVLLLFDMNFLRILLICTISIGFALNSPSHFQIEQLITDESVVLGEIITNYLVKYFSSKQIYVAIVLAPSKYDQFNFQEDLFVNLFDDPQLSEFGSSNLDRLDNTIRKFRNAFNMILIDDSESLRWVQLLIQFHF